MIENNVQEPAMRILCLHGYCQNAAIFRSKSAALRKAIEKSTGGELVYIDAPHVVPGEWPTGKSEQSVGREQDQTNGFTPRRSWWRATSDGKVYEGWEDTIAYLKQVESMHGPFTGVLGFSQGATLAHLLCAMANRPHTSPVDTPVDADQTQAGNNHIVHSNERVPGSTAEPPFSWLRFAILISGGVSRAKAHAGLLAASTHTPTSRNLNAPISLPSLHMWGSGDAIVPPEASSQLAEQFSESVRQAHVHDKGHLVPATAEARRSVADFLEQFRETNLASNRVLV